MSQKNPKHSDLRFTKRLLLRRGKTEDKVLLFADVIGNEYPYKWMAKISSFIIIVHGLIKNGFPIAVKRLHYSAWAFYPFFFLRADLETDNAEMVINHERIHIAQQRELMVVGLLITLPFCIWLGLWVLLLYVPFIPTFIYALDIIRVFITYNIFKKFGKKLSWNQLRKNTIFEREAEMHQLNTDYLKNRKLFEEFKMFDKIWQK